MPVELVIPTLETGCFLGLIALALFMVKESAALFNFAVGGLVVVGGMVSSALTVGAGLPLVLGVLVGVVSGAVLGLCIEVLVVAPLVKPGGGEDHHVVMALVAGLFAVQQMAGVAFGKSALPGVTWVNGDVLELGKLVISAQALIEIAVTVALFAAVGLLLRRTKLGRQFRSIGDNTQAATMLGMPVRRIRLLAFAASGLFAGLAGALFANRAGVAFTSALQFTLFGFLAFVIGGAANVWGPLAGGLGLAFLQALAIYHFGPAALSYVTFAAAAIFFALRPEGIFVKRVRA
ncbi:branched-chain amino acid ABC transporter permease [Streptosporangium sp. NBC_01755]|uniref:branched-chain amino acid ABC transporter permease n=1 Tax=unclassified Streptosporangium TaxID=2632669 RepID=UPI002DD7FF6C|nr:MULTISPECIES: branched-chain amino acid ABC transporter permease [unclassified Streptosporangium]WSA26761.1 branched-chain amino acid ABC transporter permease [Streptosporangium sp. NBC_01810]WSD01814.1 branched-chain amino acid ABC transporter permease [Streptosporangium sp. NBC_01755]